MSSTSATDFYGWQHATLARFATEAAEKLKKLENENAHLRNDLKKAVQWIDKVTKAVDSVCDD